MMYRLIPLALLPLLFSCSSVTDTSQMYSGSEIRLVDRSFQTYVDDNGSRRRRTICEYSDGSTVQLESAYNCAPVKPD